MMSSPSASVSTRLVDVYVSDRCIASCPVDARLEKAAAIAAARAMMKADGILTDAEADNATFRVRPDEEEPDGVA